MWEIHKQQVRDGERREERGGVEERIEERGWESVEGREWNVGKGTEGEGKWRYMFVYSRCEWFVSADDGTNGIDERTTETGDSS